MAEVFGRDVVIGFVDLNVAVAMDASRSFAQEGEQACGQWLQMGFFQSEQFGHLAFGGAVNAHVGHGSLPVRQELVQRRQ